MFTFAPRARQARTSIATPSRIATLLLLAAAAGCSAPADDAVGSASSAYTARSPVDSNIASFKAASGNIAYSLDTSGRLWKDTVSPASHVEVDANVAAFQPLPGGGFVYVLGTNGNLWLEPDAIANRVFQASGVVSFQMLSLGKILTLDSSKNLWYQVGPAGAEPRVWVDGNVSAYHAIDDTAIYVLGTDGKLWNENGSMSNRFQVDGNVTSFFPVDYSNVYVEGTDGKLWNEHGSSSNRSQVDANVETFFPVDDRTIYVEGQDGNLWREVENFNFRDHVDGTVKSFQPAGAQAAWVLGDNGNLWLEQLPPPVLVFDMSTSSTSASIGVWPNGNSAFIGTTSSGYAYPIDYSVGAEINTSTGQEFTFVTQGSLPANFPGSTSYASFSLTGSSPQLATYYGELAQSAGYHIEVVDSLDLGALWNDLQTVYNDAKQVWSVVGPIISAL